MSEPKVTSSSGALSEAAPIDPPNEDVPTDPAPAASDGRNRARSVLEEEREFFLRSLRDLEVERAAADIDEVDYRALHDDYTVRAARVLRSLALLEEHPMDPDGPSEGVTLGPEPRVAAAGREDGSGPRPSPWGTRLLTGIAVALIVGGAAWAVAAAAGVRLPGEEVSGSNPANQATQLVINAETAVADANPAQALKDYQGAIDKQPGNIEALTGEGSILVEAGAAAHDRGLVDEGINVLGRAEIVDPSYGPAYAYRGLGYYYDGNDRAAVPQLETYLSDTPPASRIASVSTILARAKARLAG